MSMLTCDRAAAFGFMGRIGRMLVGRGAVAPVAIGIVLCRSCDESNEACFVDSDVAAGIGLGAHVETVQIDCC